MQIDKYFITTSTFDMFQSFFKNNEEADLAYTTDGDSLLVFTICFSSEALDYQKKGEFLILHGSDTNAVDGNGFTALGTAAARGNYELVNLLLQHGAKPNFVQRDSHNPLVDSFYYYDEKEHESFVKTIRLLLENGTKWTYEHNGKQISISQFFEKPVHEKLIIDLLRNPEHLPEDFHRILKAFKLQNLFS